MTNHEIGDLVQSEDGSIFLILPDGKMAHFSHPRALTHLLPQVLISKSHQVGSIDLRLVRSEVVESVDRTPAIQERLKQDPRFKELVQKIGRLLSDHDFQTGHDALIAGMARDPKTNKPLIQL